MGRSKILIVEDEAEYGAQLKRVLELSGHTVLGPALDCSSALELLWLERPDLAFVDTHLGSETCEAVLDERDLQEVPVIVTTTEIIGMPQFVGDRSNVFKPVDVVAVNTAIAGLAAV